MSRERAAATKHNHDPTNKKEGEHKKHRPKSYGQIVHWLQSS